MEVLSFIVMLFYDCWDDLFDLLSGWSGVFQFEGVFLFFEVDECFVKVFGQVIGYFFLGSFGVFVGSL